MFRSTDKSRSTHEETFGPTLLLVLRPSVRTGRVEFLLVEIGLALLDRSVNDANERRRRENESAAEFH